MDCQTCYGAGRMAKTPFSPRWFPVAPDVDLEAMGRLHDAVRCELCCVCGGDGLSSDHYVVRAEEDGA